MIVFIKMVGAGMEAYDWGSEVSATCWVLFIDYEQGNGEAGADEKHDEQKELLLWMDSNKWTCTNSKYKSYVQECHKEHVLCIN